MPWRFRLYIVSRIAYVLGGLLDDIECFLSWGRSIWEVPVFEFEDYVGGGDAVVVDVVLGQAREYWEVGWWDT